MDIGKLSIFANMKAKIGWLSQNQQTIAQNIANSDTPDYRPRKLREFNPERIAHDRSFRLLVAKTNHRHSDALIKPQDFKDESLRRAYEVSPDGNSVILEEQLVALQHNSVDYNTMTQLYSKHKKMAQMAVRSSA